jgi:hypothetical protein
MSTIDLDSNDSSDNNQVLSTATSTTVNNETNTFNPISIISSITDTIPEIMNEPIKVTSISYSILEFIAGTSITVRVLLLDQYSSPIEFKNVTLDGIYYKQWANDDTYLLNFVASTLGLIINEPPGSTEPILMVVESPILYTKLYLDTNNNVILPDGFSINQFNIIMDPTSMPVKFAALHYYSDGMPNLTEQLLIGPDNNPIFPELCTRLDSGSIITRTGEYFVIIYNKN